MGDKSTHFWWKTRHSISLTELVLTLTLTQDSWAIRCFPWEQCCLVQKRLQDILPVTRKKEQKEPDTHSGQQQFHQRKWQTQSPRLGKLPFQFEWTAEFVECLWLVRWTDTGWVRQVAACHWISSLSLTSLWYTFPCNLSLFTWSCLNTNGASYVFPNCFWEA